MKFIFFFCFIWVLFRLQKAATNIFFVLYGCGSGGLKPPLICSVDFSGGLKPPLIYSDDFFGGFVPPQMFWNQPILSHFRRKKAAANIRH
jgi:hypothetical protein